MHVLELTQYYYIDDQTSWAKQFIIHKHCTLHKVNLNQTSERNVIKMGFTLLHPRQQGQSILYQAHQAVIFF
jgi:hypothetical protein